MPGFLFIFSKSLSLSRVSIVDMRADISIYNHMAYSRLLQSPIPFIGYQICQALSLSSSVTCASPPTPVSMPSASCQIPYGTM